MSVIYIISFILVFSLTLVSSLDRMYETVFNMIGIPTGFRNVSLCGILGILMTVAYLYKKNDQVIKRVAFIFIPWIPWLLYLGLRTNFDEMGIWKLEMYIIKIVFPIAVISIMYMANQELFLKLFMPTLLWVNLVLVVYAGLIYVGDTSHHYFERNIWLSRGLAINFVYLIVSGQWKKRRLLYLTLLTVLFILMLVLGARGPVISTLLIIGAYFAMKYRKNALALFWIVFGVLVAVLAFLNISSFSSATLSFLTHKHRQTFTASAMGRFSVYGPSVDIFRKNALFGIGLGKWWMVYKRDYLPANSYYKRIGRMRRIKGERDYYYPHNIFLEVASELGTTGLLLFLCLFYPFGRLTRLKNPFDILVLLGLLFACTSSDITQNSAPMLFSTISRVKLNYG